MAQTQKKAKKVSRKGMLLEAERARRFEAHLSVLLIDIDGLGLLNEKLGMEAGDELLSEVSAVLRSNLRKIDVFGRWHPEDFIVLTVDRNIFGAVALAEKLRKKVEETTFQVAKKPVKATVSIGVARGIPRDEAAVDALIEAARKALVRAKASGRNKVDVFGGEAGQYPARLGPEEG